ncbi:hypothetical protein ZTR_05580 [Talaromyces verruculosus]|nr:hypothetical protein ZTR_05580 [Talaromyces verruculosus]
MRCESTSAFSNSMQQVHLSRQYSFYNVPKTNKNPVKKEDSNGYVAVRLLGRFLTLSKAEKDALSDTQPFVQWVHAVFQIDVSSITNRMMPIIRHPDFSEIVFQFLALDMARKLVIDDCEDDYYFDSDKDKISSILVGTWETISEYLLMIRVVTSSGRKVLSRINF